MFFPCDVAKPRSQQTRVPNYRSMCDKPYFPMKSTQSRVVYNIQHARVKIAK